MKIYRRLRIAGGTYFFTVVTDRRSRWLNESTAVQRLRDAFRKTMLKHPFRVDAIVLLPDHLHAIWRLPEGDPDFSTRWRLIEHHVSTAPDKAWRWQPRFWEHALRDDKDWRNHLDYIHYNPVKHGYTHTPLNWPYSSFGQSVRNGWYEPTWGATEPDHLPTHVGE